MRCKACNEILTEKEIIWDEERGEHEEFCLCCRIKMFEYMQPEDIMSTDVTDLDGVEYE